MKVGYNFCKFCIYSECKKGGQWICTKHKKECNKLWDIQFECKDAKMLEEF